MRLTYTLLFGLLSLVASAQNFDTYVTSERLLERFQTFPGEKQPVMILLADQLDVQALDQELTERKVSLEERSVTLIPALKEKANNTQGGILQWLAQSPEVDPASIRSFWVANVIFANMDASSAAALSQRNDIALLDWDAPLELTEVKDEFSMATTVVPNGKEIGLTRIKAPALWAMGYTGYGTTGFTADTGVDPTHPALKTRFRGIYSDVPGANWYQFSGSNTDPFDCDDHGTHVTGTMVGLDRITSDTIGVAFNAHWIGGAILCGLGTSDNVGAFQWALDPDNNPNTIDDQPDVINNSWRDPTLDNPCNNVYINVLNALEAAGIAVVFSAGNEGPDDSSITNPHNINTNLVNTFTIGALNGATPSLPIASFSSRGPSDCFNADSSLFIKPEVSAPGVSVRSCVLNGGYGTKSGTSMAAPHVSGAILLLREAFPYLTGKTLKEALYFTAVDLGDPGEDNTYGMGIIDVEAAFYYLIMQGNVPVDPIATNDVLLVDLDTRNFYCDEMVGGNVIVENAGTEVLTSFSIDFQVGMTLETIEWMGDLAPGERTTVTLPGMDAPAGTHILEVEVYAPNGMDDDRPLNGKFQTEVESIAKEPLNAFIEQEASITPCESSVVVLRSEYDGPGEVRFEWYDAEEDGNLLSTGDAYLVGPLAENTTIYADAVYTEHVGLEGQEGSDFDIDGPSTQRGIVFDAKAFFTLKSVKVYAEETGFRMIKLLDSDGNTLKQKLVDITTTGETRISLGMNINPGENLQLVLDIGAGLGYNLSGPQFPYELGEFLSIKRSNFPGGAASLTRYYYFYDWEVEYREPCGRTPVNIELQDIGISPTAGFAASSTSVQLEFEDGIIDFTDNSAGAESIFWNFGDGNSSTEANPSHQYTVPGVYYVTQVVSSADGCSDASMEIIEVFPPLTSVKEVVETLPVSLIPNPASEEVFLKGEFTVGGQVQIRLMNVHGQLVRDFGEYTGQRPEITLPLEGVSAGAYFVVISWSESMAIQRLIVQ